MLSAYGEDQIILKFIRNQLKILNGDYKTRWQT